jgi:hypothetical protein
LPRVPLSLRGITTAALAEPGGRDFREPLLKQRHPIWMPQEVRS